MPLKGIDRFRLKEHFRTHSIIYIAGIIAMLLLAELIFTVTRPVVPAEKEVLVYLAGPYSNVELLDELAADTLAYGQTIDPTLESVRFESVTCSDPEQDTTSSILLATRMQIGEGDVWISSDIVYTHLADSGMCAPLDGIFPDDLGLEPLYHADVDTGEVSFAALDLTPLTSLIERGVFNSENARLSLSLTSTNPETSAAVTGYIITRLKEGL